MELNEYDFTEIGPILQKLSWADLETKRELQKYGVNVLPINFYGNSPSIEDIESSFEYSESDDNPPYPDFLFKEPRLLETLDNLSKD